MATNTTILIIVAATGSLFLFGMLAVVVRKTSPRRREDWRTTDDRERHVRRIQLADESAHRAEAAIVEIKTSLQNHYRNKTATSPDDLNEQRGHRRAG